MRRKARGASIGAVDFDDLLKKGLILGTAATIPFYVTGYFPPEKQGERYPGHEHAESGGNSSTGSQGVTVYAGTTGALVTPGTFVAPGTRWTIRF